MENVDIIMCILMAVLGLIIGIFMGAFYTIPTYFEIDGEQCLIYSREVYCRRAEVTVNG